MYFRKVFFKTIPKLTQKTIGGRRHYMDQFGSLLQKGVLLPSVTTITGILSEKRIGEWKRSVGEAEAKRIGGTATTNGTVMHSIIENYLSNKPIDQFTNKTSIKLFNQMKPELNKINNIRAQEVQLYSTKLGMAGRVDCIAEYDGVLSVIDFKSSRKRKIKSWIGGYFQQATAYALMCEEISKVKIDQIVIPISAGDGTVEVFIEDKNKYIEPLCHTISMYREKYK